jgi:hypothetical protein
MSSAFSLASRRLSVPCITGPKATFSRLVFHGNSAPFWNTTMRSEPGSALGLSALHSTSPSSRMRPDVISWNPAIALSSVVLPHPDGPTIMQISPALMSSEQ